ncbi:MAG: hypothetical protein IJY50_01145 [Clostridia bacterium]|nr:hypothetical protein [Clostridia bacterium]
MPKDIDWKETEWLVKQLRAKLEEDGDTAEADPAASRIEDLPVTEPVHTDPHPVHKESARKRKKNRYKTYGADLQAKKEMQESVPAEPEKAESTVVEEPPAEPEKAEPTVVEETPAEPGKEEAVSTEEPTSAYAYAVPPPQKRTAMFAASYDVEEPSEFIAPKAQKAKPAPQPQAVARTDEEQRAEATVEDLLQDLFGTAQDSGWFTGEEKKASPAPVAPAPAAEAPVPPKPAPSPAEPAVSQKEETVPPKKGKQKKQKRDKSAVETITRERDGQMALVLPETGKPLVIHSEEEHAQHRERHANRTDEAQIDVFSATPAELVGPRDPERDRIAFKQSIEASEDEFRMLLDLDYEEELGDAIGFEKIRSYHEEGVNGRAVPKRRRRKSGESLEYEVQGQDTSLRKRYTKQKSEHVIGLILSVALTVLLFIYEQSGWMAALLGGPFDGARYPVAYILIGLQFLVIAAFFSRKRLIEGFLRVLRFSPIDYSLCSVVFMATILYHVVLIFMPHEGAPTLYLSPAAMSLALLALADLLDWYRESLAFQVVSSRKQKYALIPRASVGGKQGNAKLRLTEDESAGTVWYLRPVGFVRNYFANTEKRVEHSRSFGSTMLLSLAIGLGLGLYCVASGKGVEAVFQTVFATFLLCVPASSLLVTSLPMFLAACLRLGKKGAIVGETPISSCGDDTTLIIPDAEVFGAMHHERFELVEEDDPLRVSILVRALLEKLQSPLCDSVIIDRDMRISPSEVTLVEIDDAGIAAVVGEQKTPMLMGSLDYLRAHGVPVKARAGFDPESGGKRLICVAVNGKVSALFLARYRLNDDMRELLHELEREDVDIVVRTKDPGIHNDLFKGLLPERKAPVRVIKPTVREMDLRTDRVDATIVALGSCREAARTFVTCRRVRRAGALGKIFQVLSVLVGALLATLLTILGGSVALSAFTVSLYLLLWCGVHAVTSYFYLREKNDEQQPQ